MFQFAAACVQMVKGAFRLELYEEEKGMGSSQMNINGTESSDDD